MLILETQNSGDSETTKRGEKEKTYSRARRTA
jgi:hypothetical protein